MIRRVKNLVRRIMTSTVMILKSQKVVPIYRECDNEQLLAGKTALITGGTGGIGFAIAEEFLRSGCKVIICGTDEGKLNKKLGELKKYGNKINGMTLNLRDVSSFPMLIKTAAQMGGQIDILVNSADVHNSEVRFLDVSENEYDFIMDINAKGLYFMMQAYAKYCIEQNVRAHILNISSQSALEPSWSPYRASKLNVEGMTRGFAQKLIKFGIVVNAIGPGPTATAMQNYEEGGNIHTLDNPIERYTMPEEVAQYAKYFVSGLGDTIVGDTLYMSGGRGIIELK